LTASGEAEGDNGEQAERRDPAPHQLAANFTT
jgi:hypothetical protein